MSDVEFDSIIEYNEESDTENVSTFKPRKKTLKVQYNLIRDFMNTHIESQIGKEAFSVLWDGLTVSLNNLGPPIRTNIQWKKVWQEYNYNHDGRRPITKTPVRTNLSGASSAGAICSIESDQSSESNPFVIMQDRINEIINKVDALTKLQVEANEYVGMLLPQILNEQRKTNDLLEKLCSRDAT